MAGQILWLNGQAKKENNVEKICPKTHVRQNQWQSKWNKAYLNASSECCYDFISDYECIFKHPVERSEYFCQELWPNLQEAKQQGTRIPIINIAHFTELPFAEEIVESGGFRGGEKKFNENAEGHSVKTKFSWWSPIFGENDKKRVRDDLGAAIQPYLDKLGDQFPGDGGDRVDKIDSGQDTEKGGDQDIEKGSDQNDEIDQEGSKQSNEKDDDSSSVGDQFSTQFASSNAFNPNAEIRYGNFYFQYGINELCDHYRNGFDGDQELQFKILGTFSYKQEVMHAVLICSQEYGNGLFKEYPSVLTPEEDNNNEAVITRDNNGDWVWKPQATGTEIKRLPNQLIPYPKYRRWEHVAFAFHIPIECGNDACMRVPDLIRNLHYLLPLKNRKGQGAN